MPVRVTIDDREWQRALALYKRATGKAWPDIINRAMGNWAGMASANNAPGSKESVASIPGRKGGVWWGYISKVLSSAEGYKIGTRRKLGEQGKSMSYRDQATGRMKTGQKTKREQRAARFGAEYRKGDRVRVSNKILRRRANTIGAIRAVLARMALEFGRPMRGWHKRTSGARRFFYTRRATEAAPVAEFMFPWTDNKPRLPNAAKSSPQQNVAFKTARTMSAIDAGKRDVIADMTRYALDQLVKQGRRVGLNVRRAL